MKKLKIALLSVSCLLGLSVAGGITSCNDTNINQSTEIVIDGNTSVTVGDSQTLVAKDGNGIVLGGVKWTSSDRSIGIVDSSEGDFFAVKAGTVIITATKAGYSQATITITITDSTLPSLVIFNSTEKTTINKGDSLALSVKDGDGNVVEGVKWKSSNTNVALVSSQGVVSAKGAGSVEISVNKDGYNPGVINLTVIDNGTVVPDDTFSITYTKQTGVKFEGPTSGKVGEKIEFTVTATDSNVEITEVTVNDSAKNKINDKYSFTMPEAPVVIKAKIKLTNADVSISGDVVAPLAKNSEGIYESDDIQIDSKANLTYLINQADGSVKQLSILDMDDFKCFAQIQLSDSEAFSLYGGFTYKFFYDPSTKKSYVKRTQVTKLPSNSDQLSYLFDSGNQSRQTTNPDNVKTVEYSNKKTQEKYTFNRYKNNTSIASVEDLTDGSHLADVYKTIENNGKQLRVADTYTEGKNYKVTDRGIKNDQPYNAYSGVYNIYDSKSDFPANSTNWSYTKEEAEYMANLYNHDYYSLELDFYEAYRGSFTIEDTLKFAKLKISSTSDVSGGFTTVVDSYKTYVDSNDETNTRHYEYDLSLSFDATGRVKEGTYKITVYDKTAYDFTNDKFLTGGETKGTVSQNLSFKYTYSDELEDAPDFDYSKYFISDITELRVNNTKVNTDESKNVLLKKDVIDIDSSVLTFKYTDKEALDYWQYGVVASSNTNVIAHTSTNLPNAYTAVYNGKSTLTFGNHTTNNVTKDVEVEVKSGTETGSWYFNGSYGNPNNSQVLTADSVEVYQGQETVFTLSSSPEGSDNSITDIQYSRNDLIELSYDAVNEKATIIPKEGSQNIEIPEEGIKVTVQVSGPSYYKDGYYNLYVYVLPKGPFTVEGLKGTWKSSAGYTAEFTTDEITDKHGKKMNKGVIKATVDGVEETLTIGWTTTSIGYLDFTTISYTGAYSGDSPEHEFDIRYSYDDSGNMVLALAWTIEVWGGLESKTTHDIIGVYDSDIEDEYFDGVEFNKQ